MPKPIIIKFTRMCDRNFVLKNSLNIGRDRKISIRTDLPQNLKVRHLKIAQSAYTLRRDKGLKTAVRESQTDVWLEFHRSNSDRNYIYNPKVKTNGNLPLKNSLMKAGGRHCLLFNLEKKLVDLAKTNKVTEETIETIQTKIATAVLIVYIVIKHRISLPEKETITLCRALAIQPDFKSEKCHEVDGLRLFFPKRMKDLPDILQKFVNDVASTSHNRHAVSQWLFCAPLLHFLHGNKVQPFQKSSSWINHKDVTPAWWGIAEYGNAIEYFKGKTTWSMQLKDLVPSLSHLFMADYLLPRTLMACLKFEQLEEIISMSVIPADACVATLYFYLMQKYNYTSSDDIKISLCF
ncbi:hypothetical protein KUTeg_007054 [Tegillarca granosa]|uniref:Uncharacterized protein n=1 Tax=Tegillarca granosa TaxID=220873 RepID=A0ABQ9FC49_TEGGR|nr:hypothetical protein KUTeg_007054 [Tegillarca granosa]